MENIKELLQLTIKAYEEVLPRIWMFEEVDECQNFLQDNNMLCGVCYFIYRKSNEDTEIYHWMEKQNVKGWICKTPAECSSIEEIYDTTIKRIRLTKELLASIKD